MELKAQGKLNIERLGCFFGRAKKSVAICLGDGASAPEPLSSVFSSARKMKREEGKENVVPNVSKARPPPLQLLLASTSEAKIINKSVPHERKMENVVLFFFFFLRPHKSRKIRLFSILDASGPSASEFLIFPCLQGSAFA